MTEPWVMIATYQGQYLAEIPLQTLKAAGIPVRTEGEETGIWGPGFAGAGLRGFQIWVRESDVEEASELLELDLAEEGDDPESAQE